METNKLVEQIMEKSLTLGAFKAAYIAVSEIKTELYFRDLCEKNLCGKYNRCWTCPPDAGNANELIASLQNYQSAVVYQTVYQLEDSFDIEGMENAAKKHNSIIQALLSEYNKNTVGKDIMHLGAGGCAVCERCAKADELPCRFPEKAISSLETYCINVSELAKSCNMKYINGQDTVTYFGAVFI